MWVAGRNIIDMPSGRVPQLRRNIGNIFQDFKLLLNKTVFENVAFAQEVIGKPKHVIRQQVPAVLDLVGLAGKEDRFPHQLSGGEQQRVSIARAFVNRPLILLADEPTGNLDPATGEGIMRLLDRINKTGTTVLMATHDQRIVNTMRKRVIQLDRGVIVRDQARGVYEYPQMLSRLTYTFRETWASFRRNMTLTVAAIITSAVSLLIFGLDAADAAGLRQPARAVGGRRRDDRLRQRRRHRRPAGRDPERARRQLPQQVETFTYCDTAVLARRGPAAARRRPVDAASCSPRRTSRRSTRSCPTDATDVDTLRQLRDSLRELPNVSNIVLADEQLDVIAKLKGFVGLYTVILSITLLFAAILLIWNTIRTAMFARRREIEVMKLVGATDWFIRVPFMLEGLIQGFIGGLGRVRRAVADQQPLDGRRRATSRRTAASPRSSSPTASRARGDADHPRHRHGRRSDRLRHRRQPLPRRVVGLAPSAVAHGLEVVRGRVGGDVAAELLARHVRAAVVEAGPDACVDELGERL